MSSCSNLDKEPDVTTISFKELDMKCRLDQNISQCDELNNTTIIIEGILAYNNGYPILHPAHLKVYDKETDWPLTIQIMGTNDERFSLNKFDNKQVVAEGIFHTSCVQEISKINELNYKALQNAEDTITLQMATGKCHYINNRALFAPKIITKDD